MSKSVLIWGAAGGIGRALVAKLNEAGWQVLAAGRNVEKLEAQAAAVYEVDVSEAFAVQTAALSLSQEVEAVDLWIYAVGDIAAQPVAEQEPAQWARYLNANLTGAYLATHYSLPLLADKAPLYYLGAQIERLKLPGLGAYVAAKAGLEALAEVVRKETRRKVVVLRPAAVATAFWEKVPFRLPANALQPVKVAERLLQAYEAGEQGVIDLAGGH